ncbi:hypothetical protein G9A89_014687 [Geosiphon pyriformis]|nr:hypothetical protein G9A89_014687 [Geosiphon pyriformis]
MPLILPFTKNIFACFHRSLGELIGNVSSETKVPFNLYFNLSRTYVTKSKSTAPYVRIEGGFKTFKPRTPGLRWVRRPVTECLWKGKPHRLLTIAKRGTGGRNNHGHITVRHRGGGHKRRIRLVDFKRLEPGPQEVLRIEYDPNRSGHLAFLKNKITGGYSYIIAPHDLLPGSTVQSYITPSPASGTAESNSDEIEDPSFQRLARLAKGNCLPLKMIPVGTQIHCIGLKPRGPGILVRAAGTSATVVKTAETGHAQVKLKSGEIRLIHVECCATIGEVSNPNHQHRMLGKAGRSRWLGIRPTVRGVAMNSVDHPHGGGRGKSKGNKHPVSPWGVLAKGGKTRKRPNKWVVKARKRR